MLDVKVELPQREYTRLLKALDPRAVEFAEVQALNRAGANVAKAGLEAVSERMGIPITKLAKRGRRVDFRGASKFGAFNPYRKATRTRPYVSIVGRGRPFNVVRFGGKAIHAGASSSLKTRRTKKGKGRIVGVQHNAWGRNQVAAGVWQLHNGAFVIGHGGTFRGVFGPGVTHVLEYPEIARKLEKIAAGRFAYHFGQAIEFVFANGIPGR